ncbi:hypothetical protein C8R44DRAFT_751652 [Mycena epipterygia]|nr:hypothetical protein C8R44DRAFT_751652 [Mycena epipterygia]
MSDQMADIGFRCLGKDSDSNPCIWALIRRFRDAGKLALTPTGVSSSSASTAKTSQDEAQQETNAGLQSQKKKKRKSTGSATWTCGSASMWNQGKPQLCSFFSILRTSGNKISLLRSKAPNAAEINKMQQYGVAAMATPARPLVINSAWTTQRCTEFLADLFPELFAHLNRHPPYADPKASKEVQQQQWLSVIKTQQSVSLAVEKLPTGAVLVEHSKRKGHKATDRVLYIATIIEVPEERIQDWDVETDSESPEEEEGFSDFEMLDEDESPRKLPAKSKGKANAKDKTPVKPRVRVKVESPASDADLPDMKHAAKMRTRLAMGVIPRKKTLPFPNSSGDEKDAIVVSDSDDGDEIVRIDPSTLAASLQAPASLSVLSGSAASTAPPPIEPPSAVASSWTSPLFSSFQQSPSPDFDQHNYHFNSLPPSPAATGNSSGWASTSSLVSSSGHNASGSSDNPGYPYLPPPLPLAQPNTSTSTSTSTFLSSLPSTIIQAPPPPPVPAPAMPSPIMDLPSNEGASVTGPSRLGGFKRGGKSKGFTNPWKH